MAWITPTGHEDEGNNWSHLGYVVTNAYDDNEGTIALHAGIDSVWSNFLGLTHAALNIESVRVKPAMSGGHKAGDLIDVDVYDGEWHDVYNGAYTDAVWTTYPHARADVTKARVRLWSTGNTARIWEFDFGEVEVGWTGKLSGVTNPAKINGIAVANIAKVNGI